MSQAFSYSVIKIMCKLPLQCQDEVMPLLRRAVDVAKHGEKKKCDVMFDLLSARLLYFEAESARLLYFEAEILEQSVT
jgi:hypothetical protein